MITNDYIGNYNFLVDFNPYHENPVRISSCDHYSKEEYLNICEDDQQYMQVMIEGSWEFDVRKSKENTSSFFSKIVSCNRSLHKNFKIIFKWI
jgi:hypothetical protein